MPSSGGWWQGARPTRPSEGILGGEARRRAVECAGLLLARRERVVDEAGRGVAELLGEARDVDEVDADGHQSSRRVASCSRSSVRRAADLRWLAGGQLEPAAHALGAAAGSARPGSHRVLGGIAAWNVSGCATARSAETWPKPSARDQRRPERLARRDRSRSPSARWRLERRSGSTLSRLRLPGTRRSRACAGRRRAARPLAPPFAWPVTVFWETTSSGLPDVRAQLRLQAIVEVGLVRVVHVRRGVVLGDDADVISGQAVALAGASRERPRGGERAEAGGRDARVQAVGEAARVGEDAADREAEGERDVTADDELRAALGLDEAGAPWCHWRATASSRRETHRVEVLAATPSRPCPRSRSCPRA